MLDERNFTLLLELIFILFFGIGDYVTTKYVMIHGGKELNPIVFILIRRWGYAGFALVKVVIIVLVIFVYPVDLLWGGVILSVGVVLWNSWCCIRLLKMKM